MGGINKYTFEDFKTAVTNRLDANSKVKVKDYENQLESIFNMAAESDGGKISYLYETDKSSDFDDLVTTGTNFLKKFLKVKPQQADQAEPDTPPQVSNELPEEFPKVDVKVAKLGPAPDSSEVNLIAKNQTSGNALGQEIVDKINNITTFSYDSVKAVKAAIAKITPENAAYVCIKVPDIAKRIDDVFAMGFGLDKSDVFDNVVKNLQEQVKSLGLKSDIECTKDSSLEEMKNYIKVASNKIAKLDYQKVTKYNEARNAAAEEMNEAGYALEMMPKVIDKVEEYKQAIIEAAKSNPKLEVQEKKDEDGNVIYKFVKLPDEKEVHIGFNSDGKVGDVFVTKDDDCINGYIDFDEDIEYSLEIDGKEISNYSKLKLSLDFEQVKPFIRAIFGQDIKFEGEEEPAADGAGE